jgi:hypothetical protein
MYSRSYLNLLLFFDFIDDEKIHELDRIDLRDCSGFRYELADLFRPKRAMSCPYVRR